MTKQKKQHAIISYMAAFLAAFYGVYGIPGASGYSFDQIVPDVRQPASLSGGSACSATSHHLLAPGAIAEQWSTVRGTTL
jgi:hypothetical protein